MYVCQRIAPVVRSRATMLPRNPASLATEATPTKTVSYQTTGDDQIEPLGAASTDVRQTTLPLSGSTA